MSGPSLPPKEFMATVATWPPHTQAHWHDLATRLAREHHIGRDEAGLMAFTKLSMGIECVPAPNRTACGHDDATVVLEVDGYGSLCGACWRRWAAGDIPWPNADGLTAQNNRRNDDVRRS